MMKKHEFSEITVANFVHRVSRKIRASPTTVTFTLVDLYIPCCKLYDLISTIRAQKQLFSL